MQCPIFSQIKAIYDWSYFLVQFFLDRFVSWEFSSNEKIAGRDQTNTKRLYNYVNTISYKDKQRECDREPSSHIAVAEFYTRDKAKQGKIKVEL